MGETNRVMFSLWFSDGHVCAKDGCFSEEKDVPNVVAVVRRHEQAILQGSTPTEMPSTSSPTPQPFWTPNPSPYPVAPPTYYPTPPPFPTYYPTPPPFPTYYPTPP